MKFQDALRLVEEFKEIKDGETSQNNENYQFGLGNILVSDPV